MMRTIVAAVLLSSVVAVPADAAQLYRWVDAQGRVEWRDTPPPETAKQVEQRVVPGNLAPPSNLPYAVQQAVKNFPVTLWTTACGPVCDKAKSHLTARHVPYTEKDAKADNEAFRKATGAMEVPVLFVGRQQLKGYSASEWDAALDAAGYPRAPAAP
ncbi:MAG TPA: glutaredoxin family protein [Burkholderiales bacterium]|nr:glutaredoxin family protein [Burkholderiales bacterium]